MIPVYFQQIIDAITATGGLPTVESIESVKAIFFKIVAVWVALYFLWRVYDYGIETIMLKLDYNVSLKCFDAIHRHSYEFFINNFAWAINKKIFRFVGAIQGLVDIFMRDITRLLLSVSTVIVVLYQKNTILGVLFLGRVIVFAFIAVILNHKREPWVTKTAEVNSKLGGVYADTIVNHYNISVFGSLAKEYQKMKDAITHWYGIAHTSVLLSTGVYAILWILSVLGEMGILYYCIYLWEHHALTVWTFVLLITYQMIVSQQIFSISHLFWRFSTQVGYSTEMLEILSTPHEIVDAPDAPELRVKQGLIEFQNVCFGYQGKQRVFENLNFSIQPWEKVAIVGPSWSGKTSLIRLLFRFYDIESGQILIDGQEISKVSQDSLRRNISIVPQEPILFHRSLKENITYVHDEVDEEELVRISKLAHCHEFISNLKEGYDTLVWERGIKLSGWERQRVAIARAMIANNHIIVLDEATSSLDSQSEKYIQDALEKLMVNQTMIVIAHRLSTIMKMDRILVFDQGRIVESGTHTELLSLEGQYKKLWEIQSWGFLGED